MKTELHPASERGHFNYGWLETYHSFSFATYFNPLHEKFGSLRVLNDDTVSGGTGFDLHPHNNMEIITIVMEGTLEHRDSLGNIQEINQKEIQVMSAGTGIYHAEYNHSEKKLVKFFQIWIFPREKGLLPRYDQKLFLTQDNENQLVTLVTPDNRQLGDSLWIHQDVYISMINLTKENKFDYTVQIPGNGLFIMLVEGNATAAEYKLEQRDALAVSDASSITIQPNEQAKLLFIEIPIK